MNESEYLEDRLDHQIEWYGRKAGRNQWWYRRLRVLEIAAAASIPFLAGLVTAEEDPAVLAVGILGIVVAVVAGVLGLFQFQENWVKYRSTAETLKHERFLFLTRTTPYGGEDPFHLLVKRVEGLTSEEHTKWAEMTGGATTEHGAAGTSGLPSQTD